MSQAQLSQEPPQALPAKIVREIAVTINELVEEDEYVLLGCHALNENPVSHFLTVWRDDEGNSRFAKARPHKRLDDALRWSYQSLSGRSKRKTAIGAYPKNARNESTFGALDFDAHSGDEELAKSRAIRAFSLLLVYRDRYLILSASGRGYHVFVFARDSRPISEWVSLLKDTADSIGAPIRDGVCEIFPNEQTEKQAIGRAIRLPGTVNPATGEPERILAETIRPLIDFLKAKNPPLDATCKSNASSPRKLLQVKEAECSFKAHIQFNASSTQGLIDKDIRNYPITCRGTRHKVLLQLTGALFHKFGRQLSEQIVCQHFETYRSNVGTPLKEHLREFSAAWERILTKTIKAFSESDNRAYNALDSDAQREAFCLLRSFSFFAKGSDFQVGQSSLGDRLSITQPGAGYILARFLELGIIRKTTAEQIGRKAICYVWSANNEVARISAGSDCSPASCGIRLERSKVDR